MQDQKKQFQFRFLIAVTLSLVILTGWSYFFAPKPPPPNANANTAANTEAMANGANSAPAPQQASSISDYQVPAGLDSAGQRFVVVETPLYTAKFDTRGAVPVSWVLLKNKTPKSEHELTSIASAKEEAVPLELISQKGAENAPRELPLRLITGDNAVDAAVNEKVYQLTGADGDTIKLSGSESKSLQFTLKDEATGVESVKTITLRADSYVTDLGIKLTRNGEAVPSTRVLIGPSIADQGVKKHHFYRYEPEAIAMVGGSEVRYLPTAITDKTDSPGRMGHTGETDWAGIGDVYFAMALVPAQKAGGVEFTGSKYEVEIPAGVTEGQTLFQWITRQTDAKETRHLTTAYVPVVADGSLNKLFVGVKDYFSFAEINKHANEGLGRAVDLEPLINYSWYEWLRWIFKPITQLVLIALSGLIGLTGSAGWSIILFTILLYSVFFPLKWHSAKSFKAAQKNAPRMKEIQEEMKRLKPDDPRLRELQLEQIRSMNPGNMLGGCLPMFLQIPFFIALYSAITISLDFRQASFLWLPDLSSRDPYHLLEFAQTGSMIISMIFAPATPAMTDEQRMQQKMMTYMMPAMMLWVLWGAPSGLLLYWFFGNLVTIGQQAIINYFHKKNEEPAAVEPEKTVVGKKKLKAKVAATETKG